MTATAPKNNVAKAPPKEPKAEPVAKTPEQLADEREALAAAGLPQPVPLMPFGSEEPPEEVGEDPAPTFQPIEEADAIAQEEATTAGLADWLILDGPASYGPMRINGNPKARALRGVPFKVDDKDQQIVLLGTRLFRLAVRKDFEAPYHGPMTTAQGEHAVRGKGQAR